ncbi:MAG TPA: alkaline phosphatase PhoX [Armatimonadota bacterium]|nr:alkaline phosphatase PhoX [Armatimonadota bacterium]
MNKGELWLPVEFNYQVISRQGMLQRDGTVTSGIFDGMGAFPGPPGLGHTTILIRNHENRERPGEVKVTTPTNPASQYDPTAFGGNSKLVVRRDRTGMDEFHNPMYTYTVIDSFNILGGTSTNCAGGVRSPHQWLTCEEVVKRQPNGLKHGYVFEIDAYSDVAVPAIPIPQLGRRSHEAAIERAGIIYMTEDRSKSPDPIAGQIGAVFYRYIPSPRGGGVPLVETRGPLEGLAIRGVPRMDMDTAAVGVPYPVVWVPVPEPDHEDDTDNRRDRAPRFTPNRVQAIDRGAAIFSRQEGMWAGPGSARGNGAKVYFDCTSGGRARLGQVWEYDPGRETLTLIYESTNAATLQNPDNVVIVPQTQDILLQEDGAGEQFIRGVTQDGQIYDFAKTGEQSDSEFCGGCFDPDGQTLYVNQQGDRGVDESGQPTAGVTPAVTYAIYGPFEKRFGNNSKNFGNGR